MSDVVDPRKISRLWISRRLGAPHLGWLRAGSLMFPCSLGRNGIGHRKREGDGMTPAGRHRVSGGYVRPERERLRYAGTDLRLTAASDGWCDDPRDANYNRPVRLPSRAGHERMFRDDALYDLVLVLDWNGKPRVKGRGSAIFLHIMPTDGGPTAGCIALAGSDLRRLVPRLAPRCEVIVRG